MYCPNCGAQNAEGSKYCQSCGTALTGTAQTTETAPKPATAPQAQPVTQATRTSGLAVASLVLGILSFPLYFVGVILGVLAIIFGALAIGKTNREPNLGGKGMAVAGLVLGIVAILLWVLLMALVFSSWLFF